MDMLGPPVCDLLFRVDVSIYLVRLYVDMASLTTLLFGAESWWSLCQYGDCDVDRDRYGYCGADRDRVAVV
jgi:hypothetical protein